MTPLHSTRPTSDSADSGERSPRQSEKQLDRLRDQLGDAQYINDPDLLKRVREWQRKSYDLPASDVEEHLESKITALKASGHAMFARAGLEDATDQFPDACSPCPHYGGGCPIATQRVVRQEINRIASEAETSSAFRREMRSLAEDYRCHRIPEWLEEWGTRYSEIIREGLDLQEEIDTRLSSMDTKGAQRKVDLQADREGER